MRDERGADITEMDVTGLRLRMVRLCEEANDFALCANVHATEPA